MCLLFMFHVILQKNFSLLEYFPSDPSMVNKEWNLYSLWVIPPDDVSLRIKKVMKALIAEFGGPEIEPHIPIVGSIRMTHEDVLNKLRSLHSCNIRAYQVKVDSVVTRNFYHQCVSLLIDSSREHVFSFSSCYHFDVLFCPKFFVLEILCTFDFMTQLFLFLGA